MSDPIRQLCAILLEKAQSRAGEDLSNIVADVLAELDRNTELSQSLRQNARMLQINMGQSKGYQVLVEANATAYIGDQYHVDTEAVIKVLGQLLDEFSKKQPIVGTPNNLPLSGAIAFIGRDSKLTELDQQLQGKNRIAITAVQGMGGIGKTELALQYAIAALPEKAYPGGICWLRSRDQEIVTQIISFARASLGLTIPDDMEASEQVTFIWQRWPEGNSLIVIDDVTDYDAIALYLPPPDPRFKVLITTRQNFGATVTTINIEELSNEAAIALLKSIVGDERIEAQRGDAQALCKWVGNLPLGLELLGRFLVGKEDWAIAKLLEQLESKRLAAKALIETESGMTATLGVAAALELSWAELSQPQQDLACLLGMFAVAPIPWSLVEACFPEVDSDELEDWRDQGLRDRSLIKRVEQGTYQLHQVVQEFFRTKLQGKGESGDAIKSSFCAVIVAQAKTLEDRPTLIQIERVRGAIAHLKETANHWLEFLPEEDMIWPFLGLGRFYQGQGNYDLAESPYLQALERLKEVLGNDHPHVASSLNNLALLYYHQGRYKEVEPLYLQALEHLKKVLGNEHPYVATSLNNLAELYGNQGHYEEAEPLCLQALELRKKVLGNEHPDVLTSLNNLAELYRNQGRYEEAEPLCLQTLELRKKVLGNDHPDVATSLSNLALLCHNQGRYEEAETLYLQAFELGKKVLSKDHPDVAISYFNLGALYHRQGQYQKAKSLYLPALHIYEQRLGQTHPNTQALLSWLNALPENTEAFSLKDLGL
jgi:tetratricopeptide (TPR) repeat protein